MNEVLLRIKYPVSYKIKTTIANNKINNGC